MASDSQPVLSVKNVKKKIGRKWIIHGVSFDIQPGEIFGFLGPNGSGKTTTIRMLVSLIKPTAGTITVCGKDLMKEHDEALQHVGAIVENPEMYAYLSGWENLEQFARMLPGVTEQRLHEVVDIVEMKQRIHDKVKTYSLGMRQRLGIAQALLGRPRLLILDEPTNGLDPQGIKQLRHFIRKLADSGMSLFISSHLLSEIQLMCDRVAIISHGRVLAVGAVDELLHQPVGRVDWHVDDRQRAQAVLAGCRVERIDPDETDAAVSHGLHVIPTRMDVERIASVNREMVGAGVNVHAIQLKMPSLEQLFLNMTEGERID